VEQKERAPDREEPGEAVDVALPRSKVALRETTTMSSTKLLTAIIEREGDGYVALCPELDIASQGGTVEQARANLKEALELFFETADSSEVARRMGSEVFVTQVEIAVG
jgi:predicted RNase H-like HicB family nuclease